MSIFTKVSILFLISISLMFYLSLQTNKIVGNKIQLLQKKQYIQASKELFGYLVSGNLDSLNHKAKMLGYDKKNFTLEDKKIVYKQDISFGSIEILQKDGLFFLYMKYLNDEVLYYDKSQYKDSQQKDNLNYLILANVFILIILFLVILKILAPLKNISIALLKFGSGNYSLRLKESKGGDEITKVTNKFNTMAENIENLINSRVQLLNDISHELRTPISKAMISLEMIEDGKYKKILKKSIMQIDELTNELLEIERLNSNNLKLEIISHSIDTILAEALSKMMIDEEEIDIKIINSFTCKADLKYFSIAIKNLIDNAIKYKTKGTVEIIIDTNKIEIKNTGEALSKELDYYLETFTQEDNSRKIKGYGLGLNIVKRVIQRHDFTLSYRYKEGYNIFSIKT